MFHRIIFLITLLQSSVLLFAQRPGICLAGMNSRQVDQLFDDVKYVNTITYEADYSRHIAEKGSFISASTRYYFQNGDIDRERITDEQGQLLSLTIYQYRDNKIYVSTTYDANDTRTLQTLYDCDSLGICTFMRLTDAIAVTISTTNIKRGDKWVEAKERFHDGEMATERYTYDKNGRLIQKTTIGSSDQTIETSYSISKKGHPTKAHTKQNGDRKTIKYEYEFDSHNNWTKRITYIDGIAKEIATREISYY